MMTWRMSLHFNRQALEGASQAFEKLHSMGLPFSKTCRLLCTNVEERFPYGKGERAAFGREEKDGRGWGGQEIVQGDSAPENERKNEAEKGADGNMESIRKWRKQRQQSGFAGNANDADINFDFEDGKVFERSNKKRPGLGCLQDPR